ncbi:MAG: DUF2125 domain-containing protein [Paracoccus sp. (in: a-proteobacteria)]|uniref:DUF2125 domain-containing protein n=1 Tax=Paracoccus sp. TaxID=267 RepID=UPI0026E0111D|nr:DUF2125 domain-containing protein [Paracoccus sp. (in: a-proteobacteria)]MDO5621112.1 DUF2125 domain-containing protein [Paracoccus sp. (in: a-proteobacteria)]
MRRFLIALLVIVLLLVAVAWLGIETLAARQLRQMVAEGGEDVQAAAVVPLRRLTRIGVGLDQLHLQGDGAEIDLPRLELWAPPYAPTAFRASLPDSAVANLAGQPVQAQMQDGRLDIEFGPLRDLAMTRAAVRLRNLVLNGQPVLARLIAQAWLGDMPADLPPEVGATYDLELDLSGLDLPGLAVVGVVSPLPGVASVQGRAQLWLTAAPAEGVLSGHVAEPELVGLQSRDGVTLRLDDLTATLRGRVQADAQGQAEGVLLIYSRDLRAILLQAQSLGLIPERSAHLAATILQGLGAAPVTGDWPEPTDGEARLPITFANGEARLAGLPLGAAPFLR